MQITEMNGLSLSQISTYGADNTSVHFGCHNSVFQKLKENNQHMLKGNCKCRLISNTLKTSNRILSAAGYDIECFVLKVYSECSCSAKKVETLKEFFEFISTQYKGIPRHVPTRWLSLLPAVQRILECWPALKSYFLSLGENDCPHIVWKFMCRDGEDATESNEDNATLSECFLLFLHNLM